MSDKWTFGNYEMEVHQVYGYTGDTFVGVYEEIKHMMGKVAEDVAQLKAAMQFMRDRHGGVNPPDNIDHGTLKEIALVRLIKQVTE